MKVDIRVGYDGLTEFIRKLETLRDDAGEMSKRAVYVGGGIVGDEMKRQIKRIPIIRDYIQGSSSKPIIGGTEEQIDGLIDSMGLAPMRLDKGWMNTKIGFDGYNDVKTKKYPRGQPNMMIARSINSGTSFRRAYPFIERAGNNSKPVAEAAMAATLQDAIDAVINH